MSDRYSISVYLNGTIQDLYLYRNWDEGCLLFEAVALGAFFAGCKTPEDYRRRAGLPDQPDLTCRELAELESWSEFPIVLDLTDRVIYADGRGADPSRAVNRRPRLDPLQVRKAARDPRKLPALLRKGAIFLDEVNCRALLELLKTDSEACGLLSRRTGAMIQAA